MKTALNHRDPSLKPADNPKVTFDMLKQHFSEIKYSCTPLDDFYSTVPAAGENPITVSAGSGPRVQSPDWSWGVPVNE